jgi:hypothetical protein
MTTDLWMRIRRLFARRTPTRKLEHIVAGYRAGVPPKNAVFAYNRERLDLMRGWVPDNPEADASGIHHRRISRHAAHRRVRAK